MTSHSAQEIVATTRQQVERVVANTLALPLTVEKVASLHISRSLVRRMDECDVSALGVSFGDSSALHAKLNEVERACRRFGLFAQFAELPKAKRDRINRIIEEGTK